MKNYYRSLQRVAEAVLFVIMELLSIVIDFLVLILPIVDWVWSFWIVCLRRFEIKLFEILNMC